jgi:hypothetical protein
MLEGVPVVDAWAWPEQELGEWREVLAPKGAGPDHRSWAGRVRRQRREGSHRNFVRPSRKARRA